ncbi:MAG TPA: tRNA lysidine(34) synthetase TilS [Candidatus Binatia bacterium]|nr:tRNA lysidine(34) synthetase TilS [Candidatus Binatia bacterium]
MTQLEEQVQQSIRRRGLLRSRQRVLVAVSGGVDSMVLLHVLSELARSNGWRLAVAHLNHQLRGRSSDADERLVQRTAKTLKLPVIVERADVRRFARSNRLSLELAARKLRHNFLARTAAKVKAPSIAVAHHVDDQLELFFLRLLRGSGAEGLAGMRWRSPSPSNPKIQLVRPLLDQSKAGLRRYAAERKVPFREDATNACLDIQRNRIRHELLPLLRTKYQPALGKTVLRVMQILGAEAEVSSELARKWLRETAFSSTGFEELPVAIQRRCLQLQLFGMGLDPNFELVEQLRLAPEKPVSVGPPVREGRGGRGRGRKGFVQGATPSQLSVVRDPDGRVRLQSVESCEFRPGSTEVSLNGRAGEMLFDGVRVQWRLSRDLPVGSLKPSRDQEFPCPAQEFFDADKVGSPILLRHWQSGDRFQPIGLRHSLKLQDFFTNQKVPRPRRHRLLLGVTALGEVFWVEGQRISDRFKLRKATIRRLLWRWQRL